MVADVKIYRYIGAGPTGSDLTSANNIRCATKDISSTNDTTYPIQIPSGAGASEDSTDYNYGYAVWTRLYADTEPDVSIDNIVWYTDGSNDFIPYVTLLVQGVDEGSYTQATGTEGISGDFFGATDDAFTFDEDSPLAVTGAWVSGTGPFADYVQYQMKVRYSAAPTPTNVETIYWAYDEI